VCAQISSTSRVLRSALTEVSRGDCISPLSLLIRAGCKSNSCLQLGFGRGRCCSSGQNPIDNLVHHQEYLLHGEAISP
jgi:hypothetical protein